MSWLILIQGVNKRVKIRYLHLCILINAFLALFLPFLIICTAAFILYTGFLMGYYDGSDMRGEEFASFLFLPITVFLLFVFGYVLIVGNRIIYQELRITKTLYTFMAVCIFISTWILNTLIDPFDMMWHFSWRHIIKLWVG